MLPLHHRDTGHAIMNHFAYNMIDNFSGPSFTMVWVTRLERATTWLRTKDSTN